MREFLVAYKIEIALFLFALVIRLGTIAIVPQIELQQYAFGADSGDYVNEAQNILAGRGFSRDYTPPYLPDAIRTPLYPLALAGVNRLTGSFIPIVFLEALLSSLLPVIGFRVAKMLLRSRTAPILVGLFLCLQLDYVFDTIFFASEGLSIIFLSWGLLELLTMSRKPRPFADASLAGFALGIATLTRPITYYLPIFFLPLLAWYGYVTGNLKNLLKAFGLFLVVFVLVLSPWLVRNFSQFGSPGMSTVGWFNVYTRIAATVVAMDSGTDFLTATQQLDDNLSTEGYIHHPPPVSELEIQDPRFMPILRTESLRIFSEHTHALAIFLLEAPFQVLTQDNTLGLASRIFGFTYAAPPAFSATVYAVHNGVRATFAVLLPFLMSPFIIHYVMRAFWFVLFVVSLIGAWILWRRGERFAALFLLGFIGYIVVLSINDGVVIDARYRVQFLMPEVVLAAAALEAWFLRPRRTILSE